MKSRTLLFTFLAGLFILPTYAVAINNPGPHDEGDLDGDVDVDMNDVSLLGTFLNGTNEPEQWQFWRADIHPFVLNGTDLCPQHDGVLTEDDYWALFYIAAREYSFAWEENCPYYDFDHDGYIDYRSGGDDCDDSRDFVNPGQIEECGAPTCSDNFDNDCDGVKDAADPDCQEWCAAAAQATTVATKNDISPYPLNSFVILFVPLAAILLLKRLRQSR